MWELEPDQAVRQRKVSEFLDEFDLKMREHASFVAAHLDACSIDEIRDVFQTVINQVARYHNRLKALEDAAGTTTTRRLSEG